MAISVSVEKLHKSSMALGELSRMENIPIALGFKIAKVINAVGKEVEAFEAARQIKIKELAKLDGEGGIVMKKDEKGNPTQAVEFKDKESEKKFSDEVKELFESEVEINIDPISISVLEDKLSPEVGKEGTIKPSILAACEWLFV